MNEQQPIPPNSFSLAKATNRQPLTVSPLQEVNEVVVLMEQTGQDCALVLKNQQLVGILTDKELIKLAFRSIPRKGVTVASVMTKNPLTIALSQLQDWVTVTSLWQQHQITHLPIVDEENRPVGVISANSFLASLLNTASPQQRPSFQRLSCVGLAEFRAMFQVLSEAVIFADTNRRIQMLNPSALRLFGYQPEELIGEQTAILYASEDEYERQGRQRFNLSAAAQREPYEVKYRRHNGEMFVGETVGTIVKNDAGEIIGFLGIIRDLTQQKQIEDQLKNVQYLIEKIGETTPNLFYIYDLQQQRNIYANREFAEALGYSPEAIAAMSREIHTHLFHPDELSRISAHHQKIALSKEQELFEIEYRVRHAQGKWHWFYSWEIVFSRNEEGLPTQILGTAIDITERKQLEQEQERFFSLSLDLFCIADSDGYFQRINPAFEKVTGYTQEELLSQSFLNFVHPEDREATIAEMAKLNQGRPTISFENRYLCRDGTYKWLAWNSFPVPEEKISYAVARDITQRKEVEQRLLLQEKGIAASKNGIVIADACQPGRPTIFVNPAFEKITGYSAAEVIGRNCRFLQGQDRSQPELVELRESLKTGQSCTVVLRNYRKDGSLFWNELSISPIYDEEGHLTHYVGVQTDVTKRIQAERSLQQQLAAVEAAVDGIAILDSEERYIYLNHSHVDMFGYEDSTELLGKSWRNLYSPEEVERFERDIFPLLLRDGYWQGEATGKRRDGSTFAEEVSLTLTEYGLVCVCRDIRERQRAAAALKASQERFELAMRGSGDGLWDWNPITDEVYYSLRFKEILGYSDDEFTNNFASWVDHLHPEDRFGVLEALDNHLYNHFSFDIEYRLRTKSGDYRWIWARGQAIWNERGQATRMAGSIGDITPLKDTQSALREANAELERRVEQRTAQLTRSNQELEQFAYIVSHDLQEPLRKMKSFSQLLVRECQAQLTENEKTNRYLDYITDAAERQQKMIQDLLKYSRLGRQNLTKVALDLNAVVEKVLEDLSIAITENQATVIWGNLPTIQASPTQMGQLFLNLIGNGIKFRGDAPPRIQIEAQWQSEEWLISVQDNGIGINPRYAERIFQVFQRLHSRSEYPGTGIGLAICRKIVEGHGGRIWVTSELGQGSTFYFTLC